MLLYKNAKIISLDLETTGLNIGQDRPWQIAIDSSVYVVNPGVSFVDEAREVCRITDDLLETILAAPRWEEKAQEIYGRIKDCDAIMAYNGLSFDMPVLKASLEAAGVKGELPPCIDPKVWAIETWPYLPNHKLKTVWDPSKTKDASKAHDAGFDCGMMRDIWDRVVEKGIKDRSLGAILQFQTSAKELQDLDWELYGTRAEDGAVYRWLSTCRKCLGEGAKDCCGGHGVVMATQKKRGMWLEMGFCGWALGRVKDLPPAVREKFENCVG